MIILLEKLIALLTRFKTFWEKREVEIELGVKRDSGWNRLRKEYVKANPKSEISGSTKDLEVHHKRPVWLFPEDEMKWENLMTVTHNEHILLCHLGSYKSYNPNIEEDAKIWKAKIEHRP